MEAADRLAELLAVGGVLAGDLEAVHGGADRAPRDAVAGLGQTRQRPLHPCHLGEDVLGGDVHVLKADLARDRRTEAELLVDLVRRDPVAVGLDEEPANRRPLLGVVFRPDDGDVRDRGVRDPRLRAVQHVVVAVGLGARVSIARGSSRAPAR